MEALLENFSNEIDFKSLFEEAPGLYLILLPDLTIVAVSNSYAKATMTKREEIIGKGLFEVFPDNPDDLTASGVSNLRASLESILKNKAPHTMAVQKYDIRRPDGVFEEKYWSPLNKPVLNAKNEIVYIIHRVEDVTDFVLMQKEQVAKDKATSDLRFRLKEMEMEIFKRSQEIQELNRDLEKKVAERTAQLESLNEILEDRVKERTLELTRLLEREKDLNELKSRFISIASHEFRTPLATVLSSISLVEKYDKAEEEEKRKKHIDRIKSSVRGLTDILTDFLSLERFEQGKVEVSMEVFNMDQFSKDIVEELKGVLKQGQVIKYKYEGKNNVIGDKKILRMIIQNLLSNSIKYSPEGREIAFNIRAQNGSMHILVKDKGIGIPPDEQKNIFTTFFRAKNAGNIQGTGLGLNIVKRYVGLLNGTITFTSMPNEETVFMVDFPANNVQNTFI